MSHGQCFSLCSLGSTNNWNYVYALRNCVQSRLSTNLPLLYQCYHLFIATLRRNLLPLFSGYKWLVWNCYNPENNILNSHDRENFKSIRKCVTSPFSSGWSVVSTKTDKMYVKMHSFRFSYVLLCFYSNYRICICEVRFPALVAPIISL
jgi:hypothetical protein